MTQLRELTDRVLAYTADDSLEPMISDFVDLVNGQLNIILRTRHNSRSARLQLNHLTGRTKLPYDFLAFRVVSLDGVDLEYVSPEQQLKLPNGICDNGVPTYTIYSDELAVRPIPRPESRVREEPWCYALDAVITKGDFTDDKGQMYNVSLHWTPDDMGVEGATGKVIVTRTDRYLGTSDTFEKIVTGPSPLVLEYSEGALKNFIYSYVFTNNEDRSNKLTVDFLADEPIQISETMNEVHVTAAPSLDVIYYHRLPPLSTFAEDGVTETPLNRFYATHPDIYFAGVMAKAWEYKMEPEKSMYWDERFKLAAFKINEMDRSDVYSGSTLQTRAV